MKHLFNRTVILLVVCAMASITALATTINRQVTFYSPVTVNGTPVKPGTYKVTFDDKTGEFTILDGKKIVAKATARLEKLEGASKSSFSYKNIGEISVLISINMNSNNRVVIINDSEIKEGNHHNGSVSE